LIFVPATGRTFSVDVWLLLRPIKTAVPREEAFFHNPDNLQLLTAVGSDACLTDLIDFAP
jgi:hypothetical protein